MIDTDEAELDAMLAAVPVAPPTLNGAKGLPRRCKTGQHQWTTREVPQHGFAIGGNGMASAFETTCDRCHIVRNEAQSAMGRKVNQRSRREERRLAALYQGRRTGHHGGPDDVQTDMTNIQSKAGTGWWSKRYWAELLKLPRTGGRVPVLIVSNGEPGHNVHRYVVVDERDFRSLFGDLLLDPPQPSDEVVARVMGPQPFHCEGCDGHDVDNALPPVLTA
jgi:hypothetical protein